MKIKKTSETRALSASVVNASNNSTTSTYSCDYINKMLKKETVTGTTDSNGFLQSTISLNNKLVVNSITQTGNGFVFPYCDKGSNIWTFKLLGWDFVPITSTNVTIDVYYYNV